MRWPKRLARRGPATDQATLTQEVIRGRFGLDADTIVADHVTVRSAFLRTDVRGAEVKVPALFHEFQVAVADGELVTVATVAYVAAPEQMKVYGRLVRDGANRATNASVRGRIVRP